MNNDATKLSFQQSLNAVAVARAQELIQQLGYALPAKVESVQGSLVTIAFECDTSPYILPKLTIPKLESPYFREPTQAGDTGVVFSADISIAQIAGVSDTLPSLSRPAGNLGALIFFPVSSKKSPSPDADAAIVLAPNGADGVFAKDGEVEIKVGAKTWTFNALGLTISTGAVMETHTHTSSTPGNPTSPPIV